MWSSINGKVATPCIAIFCLIHEMSHAALLRSYMALIMRSNSYPKRWPVRRLIGSTIHRLQVFGSFRHPAVEAALVCRSFWRLFWCMYARRYVCMYECIYVCVLYSHVCRLLLHVIVCHPAAEASLICRGFWRLFYCMYARMYVCMYVCMWLYGFIACDRLSSSSCSCTHIP